MEKRYDYVINKYQHRFLEEKFKNISIARSEAPFLKVIYKNGSIKMNDLISRLFFHKSHATRSINNLVKLGYVIKSKDPEDLRGYILTITPNGEVVARKIIKTLNEWENLIDSFLEEEERDYLNNIQIKIYEKLKAFFNEEEKND